MLVHMLVEQNYLLSIPGTLQIKGEFLFDCQKKTYSATETIRKRRYINGPSAAPCTSELKRKVRQRWEQTQDDLLRYVWGYDCEEKHRAERLLQTTIEHEHVFPLIDAY